MISKDQGRRYTWTTWWIYKFCFVYGSNCDSTCFYLYRYFDWHFRVILSVYNISVLFGRKAFHSFTLQGNKQHNNLKSVFNVLQNAIRYLVSLSQYYVKRITFKRYLLVFRSCSLQQTFWYPIVIYYECTSFN